MTASSPVVDLREAVSKHFSPLMVCRERYLLLWGGAGSGKSYFCAQKVILRCLTEPGHRFVVIRKVARTLRQSVFRRLLNQISEWSLLGCVRVNKTDMIISFSNGSEILCIGLDDPEKLKSLDEPSSAWCEEPTELLEDDFVQLDLRFRGQSSHYYQFLLSFNPISTRSWIKKRFFDTPQHSTLTYHSNYTHNPRLDAAYHAVLEDLKERNPHLWTVYAKGEWGRLQGVVYDMPTVVPRGNWPSEFRDRCYALDFGFNHKMALLELGFQDSDREVWVREIVAESGVTMPDLKVRMHAEIPSELRRHTPIWCDSANPGLIQELFDEGFNAIGVDKAGNSVYQGIQVCKGIRTHVHEDSVETLKEFETYCWAVDKNGDPLDAPVKHNDDCMDAFRYGMVSTLLRPTFKVS